jgi:hypothetical protein
MADMWHLQFVREPTSLVTKDRARKISELDGHAQNILVWNGKATEDDHLYSSHRMHLRPSTSKPLNLFKEPSSEAWPPELPVIPSGPKCGTIAYDVHRNPLRVDSSKTAFSWSPRPTANMWGWQKRETSLDNAVLLKLRREKKRRDAATVREKENKDSPHNKSEAMRSPREETNTPVKPKKPQTPRTIGDSVKRRIVELSKKYSL